MTRPSPTSEAPPPPPPATRTTPTRDTANPAHATGRATARCQSAAMTATRTGVVPISRAAWVTLVRVIPAFCRTTGPAVADRAGGQHERRAGGPDLSAGGRAAGGHAEQDRGREPEARARQPARLQPLQGQLGQRHGGPPQQPGGDEGGDSAAAVHGHTHMDTVRTRRSLASSALGAILFRTMAVELDEVDIKLLSALQEDADRTNVELARLVGLSPAATLHRVRWLKESGVIRIISAQLDPAAVGFALQLYVDGRAGPARPAVQPDLRGPAPGAAADHRGRQRGRRDGLPADHRRPRRRPTCRRCWPACPPGAASGS